MGYDGLKKVLHDHSTWFPKTSYKIIGLLLTIVNSRQILLRFGKFEWSK